MTQVLNDQEIEIMSRYSLADIRYLGAEDIKATIQDLIVTNRAKDEEIATLRTFITAQAESMELFTEQLQEGAEKLGAIDKEQVRGDVNAPNASELRQNIIILELLADLRRTERELAEAVAYVTSNRTGEEETATITYYEQEEIPRLLHRIEDITSVINAFQHTTL